MKTIHALLIAINDYPNPKHQLNGCINDRNAIDHFFREYSSLNGLQYNPLLLSDKEATRQNIINGFSHFNQLKEGDIGLLYYSGHGSQMIAPPEFWRDETDQRCETLVCYDSRIDKGHDLVDKELSYLIWKYTHQKKAHFTAIFDCCHSGTITRNINQTVRMADLNPFSITAQRFEGFEFYQQQDNYLIPPESDHIVLSASQADQSSLEVIINGKKRGLFTHSLVATLENTNLSNITYAQLSSKVGTIVNNRTQIHQPQVMALGNASVDELFLGGSIRYNAFSMVKFSSKKGWFLELGSLHGIQANTKISVNHHGEIRTLNLKSIASGETIIRSADWMKETDGHYKVNDIEGLNNTLSIAIGPGLAQSSRNNHLKAAFAKYNIDIIENLAEADYVADLIPEGYILRENKNPRSLFIPIPPTYSFESEELSEAEKFFLEDIQKVIKWTNISQHSNPLTLPNLEHALEIKMYDVHDHNNYQSVNPGGAVEVDPFKRPVFHYLQSEDKWNNPALKLSVKNNSNQTLWIGAVFMGEDFIITDVFLPVKAVKPNELAYEFTAVNMEGFRLNIIPLSFPEELHSWGETEITNQIKIFASTTPFSMDSFRQAGVQLYQKKTSRNTTLKSLALNASPSLPIHSNWISKDIIFKIHRPQADQVTSEQQDLKVGNLIIEKHAAFTCDQISLSSSQAATRSTFTPPPSNWLGLENFEPLNLAASRSIRNGLDTVEFHQIKNKESVTDDQPLKMNINIPLSENEHIIPLGYDPVTKLYFPLGHPGEESGTIHIQQLPEEENIATRSLGKSLRIFLQKVVYKKIIKRDFVYPILAIAQVNQKEEITRITNTTEVKNIITQSDIRKIVIFMHGIIGDTSDQVKVVRRAVKNHQGKRFDLTDHYDLVMTFDYESLNDPIETTAKNFKHRLKEIGLVAGHGKTVHVVAHSMGGLITRWFLEQENGDQFISHFIQVGSPNMGSPWAKSYHMGTFALAKMVNFLPIPGIINSMLKYLGTKRELLEVTVGQLQPDSPFSKKLNGPNGRADIPYTVIAGDSTLMVNRSQQEQQLLQKMLERFGETYRKKLYKLFFHDRSDDIVAMASMHGIPEGKARSIHYTNSVGANHFTYFHTEESVKILAKVLFELENKEVV